MSSDAAEILLYLSICLAIISFFASLVYILMFFLFRATSNKLTLKLILFVQIADAIFAVAIILQVFSVESCEICCQIQAFLLNFGSLSSVLCRLGNQLLLYLALTQTNMSFDKISEFKVFISVNLLSFLVSVIPIFTGDYGVSGEWCWISFDNTAGGSLRKYLLALFTFYLELWLAIIIIVALSWRISAYLKTFECKKEVRKLRKTLKFYPLVLIFCWVLPTLDRILTIFQKSGPVLQALHAVTMSTQGFLNFWFFGYRFVKKNLRKRRRFQEKILEKTEE